MDEKPHRLYRKLPQVGELLDAAQAATLPSCHSREFVTDATRAVLARIREEIKAGGHTEESLDRCLEDIVKNIESEIRILLQPSLRRVINATGVILQTNLGRAPLSEAAVRRVAEIARGYCNLEMELATGERSRRDVHVEALLLNVLALRTRRAMGALAETHGAAIVNNCAAATFLALNTLAEGGEVIVSRGELVEIGGGFRIPDILRKSGAILREVGTTNRTRIADYTAAIGPNTRLILRVHRSNFRIEGFTECPSLRELIQLGADASIPVFEDQGTGCMVALDEFGITNESSWPDSAISGATLVACSGDKLFGGPQCGILVGTRSVIDRLRANPLFRALRVDKLTYAAMEATLLAYLTGDLESVPILSMLRLSAETIRERCEVWVEALRSSRISAETMPTRSVVGGGTTPSASLPSFAVALRHPELSESALAARLREFDPPIVARVSDGRVLLDLRTVPAVEDRDLVELLRAAFGEKVRPVNEAG